MATKLTCPRCSSEIEVSDVMQEQISVRIRSEMESELQKGRDEVLSIRQSLEKQQLHLEESRATVDLQVSQKLAVAKQNLEASAIVKAREHLAVELSDRSTEVQELKKQLKETQDAELHLRKRERDLIEKTQSHELEMARAIDAQREQIRDETSSQLTAAHQLKEAEKEKQISDLRKQIDELKRKAEQGSQQTQGEVQELALENLLQSLFPHDSIEPVAKGVFGGDVLHEIFDTNGLNCGSILWESKRTKHWSHGWLAKLRDDQRSAHASIAVLVSDVLPEGMRYFGLSESVWVCNWLCAGGLATALRAGLIEAGKSRLATQGRHEKMQMVYDYLSGQEFRHRISGVVEAFVTMKSDLDSEKRSITRIWAKRERQLERALANTSGFYGDLQGIIGGSMSEIEGLQLPRLESNAESFDDDPDAFIHSAQ